MKEKGGTRALNVDVPVELYDMLSKLAIDTGLTKKEIIIRYLKHLRKYHASQRKVLDDKARQNFELDEREPE